MANILRSLFPGWGLLTHAGEDHAAERAAMPAGVAPPSRREHGRHVTPQRAVTLPAVYRALELLTTSAAQLSLDAYRGTNPVDPSPSLVRRPSLSLDRADFVEQSVMSLATSGDLFWERITANGDLVDLVILNPHAVHVSETRAGLIEYRYRGRTLRADQVSHITKMRLPGARRGLGPIQAAQAELAGAIDTRDYAGNWFHDSGQPAGVLGTDQALTAADAQLARNLWNGLDEDGHPVDQATNPSRIKVIGKGMSYEPLFLNPRDAMWLESRQFTTTEVARMFGIPASLLLAAVEGNSMTYQNVEQEWLAFTRFTLLAYTGKIERALSELLPRGMDCRFNLEALHRPDTKTRYQGHMMALGRWQTADEIRAIEKLPPLTDAQRAELAATPAAQPATEQEQNA